jgi:hypothetical protein
MAHFRDQELARPLRCRLRVARLVGELLSPPPILVVLALVVAWDSRLDPPLSRDRPILREGGHGR